jgi:hypothetical protein
MYGYNEYGTTNINLDSLSEAGAWAAISFVLAICGAIIIYFLFVNNKQEYTNKFAAWLKEFLNFQTMLIEPIMKISYLFFAIYITILSFNLIPVNFLTFLFSLIFGNIIVRVIYEATMVMISIWKNTKEINSKMKVTKKD